MSDGHKRQDAQHVGVDTSTYTGDHFWIGQPQQQVAVAVLRALGIDPKEIVGFSVHFRVNQMMTVHVEKRPRDVFGTLPLVFETYTYAVNTKTVTKQKTEAEVLADALRVVRAPEFFSNIKK